jgi:mono/diheme cytochrome c family protein
MGTAVTRRALFIVLLGALHFSCSRSDREIREWRPSDHDQEVENPEVNASPAVGENARNEVAQVAKNEGPSDRTADARGTWESLCSGCHGHIGQGDGPKGGSIGARDLSDPTWQRARSDADISNAITKGRGRMPAFSLDSESVQGLVKLIRTFVH